MRPSLKLVTNGKPSLMGWLLIAAGTGTLALVALLVVVLSVDIPLPQQAPGDEATEVSDAQGKLIGVLRGEQRRKIVPLEEISPFLQEATVAAEDRSFYQHSGISLRGMVRALFANVSSGEVQQGGSTITQQYARNAYSAVGTDRSIIRKLREVALARKIEKRYSKRKILEFYLNTIYFGRGAYGAEAASLTYFKKPAKDLDLSEAAYLAGAIRGPERFQPDRDAQAVVRARNEGLSDMVAAGYLKQAEADQAKATDILAAFKLGPTQLDSSKAGYFMEYIRRLLKTEEFGFTDAQVLGGGLKVRTSLDLRMQTAAEKAISSTLDQPTDPEVALVAMDPEGYVRAMVGGRDVVDPARALGYNFAANVGTKNQGGRQAGSAFKPFALAAFIDGGGTLKTRFDGPKTIQLNNPVCADKSGKPWRVSNFDNQGFGNIDLVTATANSVNTVYAQIMDKSVTPAQFVDMAEKAGISIPDRDRVCALALGTTDVTPIEMARAFTTFGARGKRPETLVITSIEGRGGEMLKQFKPDLQQTIDQNVADTVNFALQQVVNNGTGKGAKIGPPAAGKTGTTGSYADAWFAGYTPALTAVVWMGYPPDPSGAIPTMTNVRGKRVTGGSFPATIWRQFMTQALKGLESGPFVKPEEVVQPSPSLSPVTCPSLSVAGPDGSCVFESPSPEPSPEQTLEPLPSFEPSPVPSPSPTRPRPSPSPAPSPSAGPSPSPSPSASPSPSPSTTPSVKN